MSYTLFPHQAQARHLLSTSSAMLEWEMRVGKTRAALHAWDYMLDQGQALDLIVVTLKGVRMVWAEEMAEMGLFLPVWDVYGTNPAQTVHLEEDPGSFTASLPRMITLNWEILPHWTHKLLEMEKNRRFVLVLDESHLNCRNPANDRWKAANALQLSAYRTWELTGTSMVKSAADIYWQMKLLGKDNPLLGMSPSRFQNQYCMRIWNPFKGPQGNFEFTGSKNLRQLAERLPVVSSLKESDVRDVPLPVHLPIYLDEKQSLRASGLKDKEIEHHLAKVAPQMARLAVPYILKLEARPLVVFGWHIETTHHIAEALEAPLITGDTPATMRDAIRRKFQDGDIPILVGNYKSMGMGIDLSRASHAVLAEPWYDAALVAQALARLKGPKQQADEVVFHHLMIAGTVHEEVWRVRLGRGREIDRYRSALGQATHLR